MRYFKHRVTGDIIGVLDSVRDLIIDGKVIMLTDVVIPNRWLGNGVIAHCMPYYEISLNYKRTNKKEALARYPDFGQWRHIDDVNNRTIKTSGEWNLMQLQAKRKYGFGLPFSDKGKKLREEYLSTLNDEDRELFLSSQGKRLTSNCIYWGI